MRKRLEELWPLDRRGTHAFMALATMLVVFCFVVSLNAVFTPFFTALLVAYIFNPFVTAAEKMKVPRWCSAFFIFMLFTLFLGFLLFVVTPSIRQEFLMMTKGGELVKELPQKISVNLKETAKSYLSPEILAQLKILVRDWRDVYSSSSETLNDMAVEWLKNIFLQVGALSSWFLDFLLVPFYFFFIVISLNRTWDFVESTFIPYDYREQILRILSKVHFSLSSFFRGRLVICVIIGILAWLGFSFMGVPFAFLLGFSVGFATIVPLLGLVFLVPAMLCFGIIGASVEQQLVLLIFYGILQGLEMLVLGPFILGKEVELPPMILVMSVLICGYLFGGIGVVLAVPIASTVKILMAEFVYPSFVELSKKGSDYTGVERRRKGEKESVPKANSY